MKIKLFSAFSALFLGLVLVNSCSEKEDVGQEASFRGNIHSATLIGEYTPTQVDSVKLAVSSSPVLGAISSVYSIRMYKVVYETIDPQGRKTLASGALVIPMNTGGSLPLTAYCHGTVTRKADVPSNNSTELAIGIILASSNGFAVCLPDYLGLGTTPGMYAGIHPYQHAKSEATATVDMIRASKSQMALLSSVEPLNSKLFIFGYSQGGHSALASLKEIETFHSDEFTVTACAPMAGAHDMAESQSRFLESTNPYSAPYYLPYLVFAYNEVYSLYPQGPKQFLKEPYASALPPLMDGTHGGGAINDVVGSVPHRIFKDEIYNSYLNDPHNTFKAALKENATFNFKPKAPVRLMACQGDTHVNFENSVRAYNSFRSQGVNNCELKLFGNLDHGDCVIPCLLDALGWFVSLR